MPFVYTVWKYRLNNGKLGAGYIERQGTAEELVKMGCHESVRRVTQTYSRNLKEQICNFGGYDKNKRHVSIWTREWKPEPEQEYAPYTAVPDAVSLDAKGNLAFFWPKLDDAKKTQRNRKIIQQRREYEEETLKIVSGGGRRLMPYIYSVYEIERENGKEIGRRLICEGTAKDLVNDGVYAGETTVSAAFASSIRKQLRGSKQLKRVWEREWAPKPGEKKTSRYYLPDKVEPKKQEAPAAAASEQKDAPKQKTKQKAEVLKPKKEKDAGIVKSNTNGETYMRTRTGKFIRKPDALMLDVRDMEAENDKRIEHGLLPLSYGYWRAAQTGRI